VKQGVLLDACTLDVAVIGDPAAAQVFVDAVMPGAVGRVAGVGGGPGGGILLRCWWLLLLLILALLVIAWLWLRKK
jgi:hypothetical protein